MNRKKGDNLVKRYVTCFSSAFVQSFYKFQHDHGKFVPLHSCPPPQPTPSSIVH